jgi:DNA-directed RNA polymerase specialized sigma24 family protein
MVESAETGQEQIDGRMTGGTQGLLEGHEVLLAFRQGDPSAFETLFHFHQRAIYGWVLRIVRNPAAAEEVTVEAFWRIYRSHARLDPARGFEGRARRIATHAGRTRKSPRRSASPSPRSNCASFAHFAS